MDHDDRGTASSSPVGSRGSLRIIDWALNTTSSSVMPRQSPALPSARDECCGLESAAGEEMNSLFMRALAPFQTGANDTDVLINQVHFNRTALNLYNYTLYTNGTLSNGSECYLAFDEFKPHLFAENGTVVNGTSCYAPVNRLGQHGSLGLFFAFMFSVSVFFTLINLRKHGRRLLPIDRRWNIMGRRLKWFWLLFVAVCGTVSCFMSVDVDRGYLQSAALTMQSVFYTLITPGLMAAVWEAVRHWGSWQERQIFDRDPYAFTKPSTREGQEFTLPILFYAFAIVNFILTVPRSWSAIERQRSAEQQELDARPVATDVRWRTAGFMALGGMLVICYSLEHSIYRYKPRPTGVLSQLLFYINEVPSEFLVVIALLGVRIGYSIMSSFEWSVSPLKSDVNSGWIYGLGYAPALLVIIVMNLCGFSELNEDRALIAQRDEIETAVANDVGVGQRKPSWWKSGRLRTFAREITGNRRLSSPDSNDLEHYVEMGVIKPQSQGNEPQKTETNPSSPFKEDTRVTTRIASQTSGTTSAASEPGLTPHRMEYVIQPGNPQNSSDDTLTDSAVPRR
ncbi:hypothetical protein EYZ11_001931 [Aspergillus tanneri]|uniref:Uncharacterized protein n=1 Tax=Aspergillus tanneri TaxID=1220188 RepID=A0A4S3JRZ7_9EURO|nr:uncharacterized protein ATNIH1004_007494 [Aspergillus tanneri]KAA8646071.1 hypothetical protein ATNIH1004_007494 [Aspergillus tanneri]THC98579.1 hypothetical protein EYZ11_001931 [Aspergillus tanneri]